ncbi:MAG: UDP-N-acetylmuramate--L-alanine ligase [Acidimicrobiales bacterium]
MVAQVLLPGSPRQFHIIGVGGAGMSAIASVLAEMGHQVSGSDVRASRALERLRASGVRTFVGHDAANLGGAEIVGYSAAIRADNVELAESRRRGLQVLRRAELLAAICATGKALAVSGTHGKTTTTAMLARVMDAAGMKPSWLVGGEPIGSVPGAHWSAGDWVVVEADESDGTFLELGAYGAVVTSIEADHLDHYLGLEDLEAAFDKFVADVPGPRVVCLDDPGAGALARVGRAVVGYGTTPGAAYEITDIELGGGGSRFRARARGKDLGRFELAVPGAHNVRNAVAALAMAMEVGASPGAARGALASYEGVSRRFERLGSKDGVSYIDDYAHLPGEVEATLAAARREHSGRLVAVFQPHRFSRTQALWEKFADAFEGADVLVLTGIYPAGEQERPGVSGRLVEQAVKTAHPGLRVEYAESRSELVGLLRALLRPGDLCLTMGAGDVTTLPDELMRGHSEAKGEVGYERAGR